MKGRVRDGIEFQIYRDELAYILGNEESDMRIVKQEIPTLRSIKPVAFRYLRVKVFDKTSAVYCFNFNYFIYYIS